MNTKIEIYKKGGRKPITTLQSAFRDFLVQSWSDLDDEISNSMFISLESGGRVVITKGDKQG